MMSTVTDDDPRLAVLQAGEFSFEGATLAYTLPAEETVSITGVAPIQPRWQKHAPRNGPNKPKNLPPPFPLTIRGRLELKGDSGWRWADRTSFQTADGRELFGEDQYRRPISALDPLVSTAVAVSWKRDLRKAWVAHAAGLQLERAWRLERLLWQRRSLQTAARSFTSTAMTYLWALERLDAFLADAAAVDRTPTTREQWHNPQPWFQIEHDLFEVLRKYGDELIPFREQYEPLPVRKATT